jgi:hypothetical protein
VPGGDRLRDEGQGETGSRGFADDDDAEHNRHDRRVQVWHGRAGPDVRSSLFCNVLYDVPLVPQPNKFSCWAAGVSMMSGYRRHTSISPEEVYRRTGDDINSTTGMPWDEQLNRLEAVFGIRPVPESTTTGGVTTPARWCDWLTRYGPLYVTVAGNPSHAVVVRGMIADDHSATIYLNDPWDRTAHFDSDVVVFNPPNRGWRGHVPFADFIRNFYGVDLGTEGSRSRVMYIP